MADPTSVLTYDDFRIRVAEFIGVASYGAGGTGAAALPTDTHDLDVVSRIVNDGYRRFLSERDWNFLKIPFTIPFVTQYSGTITTGGTTTIADSSRTEADDFFNTFLIKVTLADGTEQVRTVSDYTGATGTFTVSSAFSPTIAIGDTYKVAAATAVDGENYRYYLPDDFDGFVDPKFTFEPSSNLGRDVVAKSDHEIRALRAGGTSAGDPIFYAIRPIVTTNTDTGNRTEIIFWPDPNDTKKVTSRYKRLADSFSTGTDRSIAGPGFDVVLIYGMQAEAEAQRFDKVGLWEAKYQAALGKAVEKDKLNLPRSLGQMVDSSDGQRQAINRSGLVDGVHGLDI